MHQQHTTIGTPSHRASRLGSTPHPHNVALVGPLKRPRQSIGNPSVLFTNPPHRHLGEVQGSHGGPERRHAAHAHAPRRVVHLDAAGRRRLVGGRRVGHAEREGRRTVGHVGRDVLVVLLVVLAAVELLDDVNRLLVDLAVSGTNERAQNTGSEVCSFSLG